MTIRPLQAWIGGAWQGGLEIEIFGGQITAIRSTSRADDGSLLSPAFVNAHSHLEYRGLQGAIPAMDYWPWIREITARKLSDTSDEIERACRVAALENRLAGVFYVGEHSDRPFAAQALQHAGLQGRIFQEVITFFEQESPGEKILATSRKAAAQSEYGFDVSLNPHATYTVDLVTLQDLTTVQRVSIHVAESVYERELFEHHDGPIADFFRQNSLSLPAEKMPLLEFLDLARLLQPMNQLVHGCDFRRDEIELLADSGIVLAHCPRSNVALECPVAPIAAMRRAGIQVGLGLDSAASSGSIDFVAEMRCAWDSANALGDPLTADDIWRMATSEGAESMGIEGYGIEIGSVTPLIRIDSAGAGAEEILSGRDAVRIEWVAP